MYIFEHTIIPPDNSTVFAHYHHMLLQGVGTSYYYYRYFMTLRWLKHSTWRQPSNTNWRTVSEGITILCSKRAVILCTCRWSRPRSSHWYATKIWRGRLQIKIIIYSNKTVSNHPNMFEPYCLVLLTALSLNTNFYILWLTIRMLYITC